MRTVNSLSGGKTSSYIAKHYPADYNVFALVRTTDKNCIYPDKKLRQIVSDKLGVEFIGTLEDDVIIHTMLDLEQFIGQKINWVTGEPFDNIIIRGDKKYLPNVTQRFCTVEMKLKPIFNWWLNNCNMQPIKTRIGFRANETRRVNNMLARCNAEGLLEHKYIIGKSKNGKRNKWKTVGWQKPVFPLLNPPIFKDQIEAYWKGKPVRFAYLNNCIGCFHRNPVLLRYMSEKHPKKYQWFIDQEEDKGYGHKAKRTFKNGTTYREIKNSLKQMRFFDENFTECDSGYCGL
tara:strand:+ start:454 stop:1320 length:867 start_codon:yes stop_codon:yes gene_type:complete